MNDNMNVVLIITFLTCITTVSGMNCYQCNSTLDHNCQEFFDMNNPNIPLRSEPCEMYAAKYCIKVTGLWGGVVGTHRFCSAKDLGRQCQDMRFPDHSRFYRGCIFTCSGDGCNTAASVISSWLTTTLTVVTSLAVLLHTKL